MRKCEYGIHGGIWGAYQKKAHALQAVFKSAYQNFTLTRAVNDNVNGLFVFTQAGGGTLANK